MPGVPPTFQDVIDSGAVRERMQIGTSSRWTNDSRTTFNVYAHMHTGLASDQRDCPPGCFFQATCSHSGRVSTPFGGYAFPLPAELSIKTMVEIHAGVVVCLYFILANGATEELASLVLDALASTY